MTAVSARPRGQTGAALAAAEVALFGVHLAVVIGFARLYRGGGFIGDLFAFTVVASLLAVASRRGRIPVPVAFAVGVGGLALLSTWLLFPGTTAFGLPTTATWHGAGQALGVSRETFRTVAAPTRPIVGFQLVSGIALWGAVWFADWAAFRLRATAEAVAPAGILFVIGAVLGSGQHRYLLASLFAAAVLVFAATHRALRAHLDQAWLTTSPVQGPRAVLRAGIATAAVAVAVASVVAPMLPGADAEPLVRWRASRSSGGSRTTVSPIVDLRRRLVSQSDVELFDVTADQRSYWRLTALDRFDGQIWSSGGEFSSAKGRLPSAGPAATTTRTISQKFEIKALAAIWAPGAYQAAVLEKSSQGLRWDPESSTLIVDSSAASSDGLSYQLTSEAPHREPAVLRRATGADPPDIDRHYEALPATFPQYVRDEARRTVAGGATRYDRARRLQDYFQSGAFTYTTDVRPGHDDNALVSFLRARLGYCEQFAGAYAAMARSVGIPARVAVGFTPGDLDPKVPNRYIVRGIHAHAWPEVYFAGVGWVPFEPTPGRGLPDATQYTGLPEAQAHGSAPAVPETTSTTTAAPGTPTTRPDPNAGEGARTRGVAADPGDDDAGPGTPWVRLALAALILSAAWVALVLAAPVIRSARRRHSHQPDRRALDAWDDARSPIRWLTGLAPADAETHLEFAHRVGPLLDDLGLVVGDLAAIATRATWDPQGLDDAHADRAVELARHLRREAARRQPAGLRIRRRLSWREAFDAPRPTGGGLPLPLGG